MSRVKFREEAALSEVVSLRQRQNGSLMAGDPPVFLLLQRGTLLQPPGIYIEHILLSTRPLPGPPSCLKWTERHFQKLERGEKWHTWAEQSSKGPGLGSAGGKRESHEASLYPSSQPLQEKWFSEHTHIHFYWVTFKHHLKDRVPETYGGLEVQIPTLLPPPPCYLSVVLVDLGLKCFVRTPHILWGWGLV